jgi:hypothetical protein
MLAASYGCEANPNITLEMEPVGSVQKNVGEPFDIVMTSMWEVPVTVTVKLP